MKELVEYIVKNLVNNSEAVKVQETPTPQLLVIDVYLDKADFGKVIGKKGATINSIRIILNAVATRMGMKVMLNVVE